VHDRDVTGSADDPGVMLVLGTHAMMTIAKLKVADVKGYSRGEYVA
jgi:hypothetical protein